MRFLELGMGRLEAWVSDWIWGYWVIWYGWVGRWGKGEVSLTRTQLVVEGSPREPLDRRFCFRRSPETVWSAEPGQYLALWIT